MNTKEMSAPVPLKLKLMLHTLVYSQKKMILKRSRMLKKHFSKLVYVLKRLPTRNLKFLKRNSE